MSKKLLLKVLTLLLFTSFTYAESKCEEIGAILGAEEASKSHHVCNIFVPRNDIISTLDGFTLDPEIGIGLTVSVIPIKGHKGKLVEGEIAVLEEEIQTATSFLETNHFEVMAIKNHYLFEDPKIIFMHFEKVGNPLKIAAEIRTLANLIGDFGPRSGIFPPSSLDGAALNNILNLEGEIKPGGAYGAEFIRPFKIDNDGAISHPHGMIALQGTTSSALIVGEIPLKVKEIQRFIQALIDQGLLVTAMHNHELVEKPRVYYVHFEQFGLPAAELAQRARQALNTIKIESE